MATLFVANAEIATRLPPLRPMRRDAAAAATSVRQEMRQLVTQCAVDLGFAMLTKQGIERDQVAVIICASGSGAEPRVPLHAYERHELPRTDGLQ